MHKNLLVLSVFLILAVTAKETKKNHTESENYDAPWPKLITTPNDIEIQVISKEEGSYVYQSSNYEFNSDAKLSKVPVKRFSVLFEATNNYMKSLPIGMKKAHLENENRYKVVLFKEYSSYVRAGGIKGSSGVYMGGRKDIVMIPFSSLGLKKSGSSYRYDYSKQNKTISHEIVHQLTDPILYKANAGALGWFTEGLAEYVAATPYRGGKYMASSAPKEGKTFATAFSKRYKIGRDIGTKIDMPPLKEFMNYSYQEFTEDSNFNYAVGHLFVIHYFHYNEDNKGTNIKNFLKAIKKGKKAKETHSILFDGRTYEEEEERISKSWKKRGVTIKFLEQEKKKKNK